MEKQLYPRAIIGALSAVGCFKLLQQNALGLGLATMLVLTCTNTVVSLFRKQIPHEIRIPIYVMIIATTVTVVQLLMNAYTYTLYQALGIFIPLIVTNCIVIGRAEAFASKIA